jgi:hypothetical protein
MIDKIYNMRVVNNIYLYLKIKQFRLQQGAVVLTFFGRGEINPGVVAKMKPQTHL